MATYEVSHELGRAVGRPPQCQSSNDAVSSDGQPSTSTGSWPTVTRSSLPLSRAGGGEPVPIRSITFNKWSTGLAWLYLDDLHLV